METEGSLPCQQEPVATILSEINPVHTLPQYFSYDPV